jgi:hypothetical protein
MRSRSILVALALSTLACGDAFTIAPFGSASGVGGNVDPTTSQGGSTGEGGSGSTGNGTPGVGGATGSGGATAGAGGSPCDASDADKDGVSVCDGDCDDNNPFLWPGAPELCGDGILNNCTMGTDPSFCGGKGTFVATLLGDDKNPGTKEKPLKTVEAGMANAATLNKQPVFVAAGTYTPQSPPAWGQPSFRLVDGISLLGGYRCDMALCDWARDPKKHLTTLQAADETGIFAPADVTNATVVEGFTILGKNVELLIDAFVCAVTIEGAPILRGNDIRGPKVGGFGNPSSVGVRIPKAPSTSATAELVGNQVIAGASGNITIGVGIQKGGRAFVSRNQVQGGVGKWSRAVAIGFGSSNVALVRNQIAAGPCTSQGTTFAVYLDDTVSPTLDGNRINTKAELLGGTSGCSQFAWSGGIDSSSPGAVLTNNVVFGVPGVYQSAGILLRDGSGTDSAATKSPIVNANTVGGGGAGGTVSSAIVWMAESASWKGGKVRNNILLAGDAMYRYSAYVDSDVGLTVTPEAFENNDLWGPNSTPLYVAGMPYATVEKVNTTLAGAKNNIAVDPKLDANFHLTSDACVDKGTTTEAPKKDFEGDDRPQGKGIDIGADEKG